MAILLDRELLLALFLQHFLLLIWKSRECGFRDRNTHGLIGTQEKEIITKLRQEIGPDLASVMARVGVVRVRNTKIICYLKTPSFSSCKQIREAIKVFIEKENIKLGLQGTTPFVTEEKLVWRQEQRSLGELWGWLSNSTMKAKLHPCMFVNRGQRHLLKPPLPKPPPPLQL